MMNRCRNITAGSNFCTRHWISSVAQRSRKRFRGSVEYLEINRTDRSPSVSIQGYCFETNAIDYKLQLAKSDIKDNDRLARYLDAFAHTKTTMIVLERVD